MSRASSTLSHSSRTKCFRLEVSRCLPRTRARMRPGVPTTTVGGSFFNLLMCWEIGYPPYITSTDTFFESICFVNLSYSFLIWNASSRVWHNTRTDTGFGSSSSWWSVVSTKTAVFPMPDLAWHRTSTPIIDYGMHSYWTSEGCSNPQSPMAFISSGFRRKSLKPVEWMPANWSWFLRTRNMISKGQIRGEFYIGGQPAIMPLSSVINTKSTHALSEGVQSRRPRCKFSVGRWPPHDDGFRF